MKRLDVHSTAALLRAASRVLILGHVQPDGDCLGSMTALSLGLEAIGTQTDVWSGDAVPVKYRFIAGNIQQPSRELAGAHDLIAIVDTPTLARVGINPEFVHTGAPLLSIDHHPLGRDEFTYAFNDVSQAAAGCLVYEVLRELGAPITRNIGNALYAAIITDTGCFTYQNVNRRVLEIVIELIDAGVDVYDIARTIYSSASVGQMRLLGLTLNTLELVGNGKGAVMHVSRDMFAREQLAAADTEDFVNFGRAILGVEVAAMVSEMPDGTLRLSLRSKRPLYDVSKLAKQFHGGGHPGAAGALVREPFPAFLDKLKERITAFIERAEHAKHTRKGPHEHGT